MPKRNTYNPALTKTTYPQFNEATEADEVANACAAGVHGKTVLIIGVNVEGIGFSAAAAAAAAFYPDVDYRPLILNLSSQKDVRAAAEELPSWSDVPSIDIIVDTAGITLLPDRHITEDGVELTSATNDIGHYLFTCLVMPKVVKAAGANAKGTTRIVNVSSMSPVWPSMRWSDRNFDKINKDLPEEEQPTYSNHRAWGTKDLEEESDIPLEACHQSKVANLLFSIGANKRLYDEYGVLSFTVHPGVIETELGRHASEDTRDAVQKMQDGGEFVRKSLGAGAATTLVAALDPKLGQSEARNGKQTHGVFLWDCQISDKANARAESSDEAEKL